MVAITVILAAVIATFVLGIGDSTEATPTAQFGFDYDNANDELTVTHEGGDTIDTARLTITGTDSGDLATTPFSGDVISGSSETVSPVTPGETVRVTWTSEGGDSTQTLASFEVPGSLTTSLTAGTDPVIQTGSSTLTLSVQKNGQSVNTGTLSWTITDNSSHASLTSKDTSLTSGTATADLDEDNGSGSDKDVTVEVTITGGPADGTTETVTVTVNG
jgi:FlaG/FlaF family flagellin (archaellin)